MALDKQPEAVFSVIIEPRASGATKTAGDTIGMYRKKVGQRLSGEICAAGVAYFLSPAQQ